MKKENYYNPEIPKQTKSRFRNITLYRNCEYQGHGNQSSK